jgi:hypothetical protein
MLLHLIEKIESIEEITIHNNNLIGFVLSKGRKSVNFSENNQKPISVHIETDMMQYLEENDIPLDLFGDA